MRKDIVYAVRTLTRSPLFLLVAVGSLALGIGANTAIFSLMDYLLLRRLPVPRPEEIVQLDDPGPRMGMTMNDRSWSYPMYRELRAKTQTLASLAGEYPTPFSLSEGGQTEQVRGDIVTGNYFLTFEIRAALGRLFHDGDEATPGAHPVVVLSHHYWQRRFGGARDVVGKRVLLNGQPMTVIGVAQEGFAGLSRQNHVDVFAPVMMKKVLTPTWDGLDSNRVCWLQLFGRLKPGVTRTQAAAELGTIYSPMIRADLDTISGLPQRARDRWLREKRLEVRDGSQGAPDDRNELTAPFQALMGMVALVLLIACANVANLLLARSAGRRREISIRLALGASRAQIIRQLLVESVLLGLLGGVAGLILATWTVDLLLQVFAAPEQLVLAVEDLIDGRVLAFNFLLAVATGIVFGLVPALEATRNVAPALKEEAGNVSVSQSQVRFRKLLIAGQVALSVVLLVGAGLFSRSLLRLLQVDPGFRPESLIQFTIDPSLNAYSNARSIEMMTRLQESLNGVPGVVAASGATLPLLENSISQRTVNIPGYQPKEGENMNPVVNTVTPRYFETLGLPLLLGRDILPSDTAASSLVAIVNEEFVAQFFPKESPIGKKFHFGRRADPGKLIEIVGVVRNSKHGNLRERPRRIVYTAVAQDPSIGPLTYYVRSRMDPAAAGAAIRREVARLDANLPVTAVRTVERQIASSLTAERLVASLSSAFGVLATVLAGVGLYGIMAVIVTRRTREIGIRMALGALRGTVLWLVMREVLLVTAIGLGIGIPLAIAAARLIESQLFGVTGADLVVVAASVGILSVAAALAGYLPARRATAIDPIHALRYE